MLTNVLKSLGRAAVMVLALTGLNAQAGVLAGNALTGSNSADCTFQCLGGAVFGAENFSLSSASRIESFTIYGVSSSSAIAASWSLRAAGATPGDVLAMGTTANAVLADTGGHPACCSWANILTLTFDIPNLDLSAGDYWLALHVNADSAVYWSDTTTGDHVVASSYDIGASWAGNYAGSTLNRAFSINGTVNAAAVPEPATVLLSLAGFAGLLVSRRARRA